MSLALKAGQPAIEALFSKQPNRADGLGETALHYAAAAGMRDAAVILLGLGADPELKSAAGETPAAVARRRGHAELAEFLNAPTR